MPRGEKRAGGRPKGSKSPKRVKTEQIIKDFVASGEETPLEIMLSVMRQSWCQVPPNISLALHTAEMAAPYVNSKLAAITLKNDGDKPFSVKIVDDA